MILRECIADHQNITQIDSLFDITEEYLNNYPGFVLDYKKRFEDYDDNEEAMQIRFHLHVLKHIINKHPSWYTSQLVTPTTKYQQLIQYYKNVDQDEGDRLLSLIQHRIKTYNRILDVLDSYQNMIHYLIDHPELSKKECTKSKPLNINNKENMVE